MGLHHQDASDNSGLQLVLGLALTGSPEETITSTTTTTTTPSPSNKVVENHLTLSVTPRHCDVEPSLTLGLCGGESNNNNDNNNNYMQQHVVKVQVPRTKMDSIGHNMMNRVYREEPLELSAQTSPHSVVSSFSTGRVKRERDLSSEETEAAEIERVSSRVSDEDEDGTTARKKLRLTKDQSVLLEESFKQHSTLNPKQKQALARQLNLLPRQVEVWFQNRRARTKLKQTEVDCEFLKKCCESLTDENRRLQKELQELKALKLAQPLYMPMPAATLTMCPSCERLGGVSAGSSNKSPFSLGPKTHFYNPFTNPSAAC